MVRPAMARSVSSTNPLSLSVSVWIITCTSCSSATRRQQSMAAGVVPQSSWSFSAAAPARTISTTASGREALPLPESATFIGTESIAWSIRAMCQGPGVQVVASVPWAGPVPPPSMVVTPEWSASSICCGQIQWMCASKAPAVRIRPSAASASVPGPITMSTPGCVSGLPALPMAWMRPSRRPTSAFTMPPWSTISALVMTVSTAPSARVACDWPMPSRIALPPPKTTSSP